MPTRMRGPLVSGQEHPLLREGGALLAGAVTSALIGPPPPRYGPGPGPPPPPGRPGGPPPEPFEGGREPGIRRF